MKEKIYNFLKNNTALVLCGLAVAIMIVVLVLVFALGGSNDEKNDISWGMGLTESVPKFENTAESIENGNGFVTAYYNNVTSEQVEAYTERIESEMGIKFLSDKYPRSAIGEDKIIVIHYNVTEMKMSVTVTEAEQ